VTLKPGKDEENGNKGANIGRNGTLYGWDYQKGRHWHNEAPNPNEDFFAFLRALLSGMPAAR
jgi:hypothetical protein